MRVVTGDWDQADLDDPRTLPLINYGLSGVNRFEHCDAAYCLTGYYVNEATVAEAVHDLDASTKRYPVRIRTAVDPPRRTATVELPDDRETIVPQVARWVLEQKEADVVVQAVGRVRPFTRPREVITFHAARCPKCVPPCSSARSARPAAISGSRPAADPKPSRGPPRPAGSRPWASRTPGSRRN